MKALLWPLKRSGREMGRAQGLPGEGLEMSIEAENWEAEKGFLGLREESRRELIELQRDRPELANEVGKLLSDHDKMIISLRDKIPATEEKLSLVKLSKGLRNLRTFIPYLNRLGPSSLLISCLPWKPLC